MIRLIIALGCLGAIGTGHCGAAAPPEYLSDYMTMTVCEGPAGNAIPGAAPGDFACKGTRKIKPGEVPPYQLNDFAATGSPCPDRLGVTSRQNVPVVIGAVTRIVSFDRHASRSGCIEKGTPALAESSVGIRVYPRRCHADRTDQFRFAFRLQRRSIRVGPLFARLGHRAIDAAAGRNPGLRGVHGHIVRRQSRRPVRSLPDGRTARPDRLGTGRHGLHRRHDLAHADIQSLQFR